MADDAAQQPLLRMRGISKAFPGVQALNEVDLTLHAGGVASGNAYHKRATGVDGVVARGTLEAGGIPLSINWHQYFDKDAEVATALDFQGNMSDEHLAALGIKTAPYLTGIIGVDGRVVDYNGGNTDIQATATLDKAQLAIPQLPPQPCSSKPRVDTEQLRRWGHPQHR